MSKIILKKVGYTTTPSENQYVTIKYRLATALDTPANYTTVTTTALVLINTNLSPQIVIDGLAPSTSYVVWITNNCSPGSQGIKKTFITPSTGCVSIGDVQGETSD